VQFCAKRRISWKGSQIQNFRRHRVIEPPRQSDDCVSRRAFRPFRFRAPASNITTMAFAIVNQVD
jgi:hypothetical protein